MRFFREKYILLISSGYKQFYTILLYAAFCMYLLHYVLQKSNSTHHLSLNIVMQSIHYLNVMFCLLLNLVSLSCVSEDILPDLMAKSDQSHCS